MATGDSKSALQKPVLQALGFIALGIGLGFLVRLLWPNSGHKKQ